MKISLGCDEAAYQLKETIKQHLQEAGHEVIDNGVGEGEVELYPDVAVRTWHIYMWNRNWNGNDSQQSAGNPSSSLP